MSQQVLTPLVALHQSQLGTDTPQTNQYIEFLHNIREAAPAVGDQK
jgi:hypothetical protein